MITIGELKDSLKGVLGRDRDIKLLTTDEFAQANGYSYKGVRTLLNRGKVNKAFKIGHDWFIPEDADIDVKQYKKKRSRKPIGIDGFCS